VNLRHPFVALALWCVVFLAFVSGLCAQNVPLRHVGFPQDWSQHQIVFSRDALARNPDLILREPRVMQQLIERTQAPNWGSLPGADSIAPRHGKSGSENRDWEVTDLGQRLRVNTFPAKFSFDPSAPPSCADDYVVFALDIVGVTGGQANLVAFNNLYVNDDGTGYCPVLTAPTVLFAYNVSTDGGKLNTSPVLSLDGTEIAFVESLGGSSGAAIFHVLTWTAGEGAIGVAAPPASATTSMTSLTYAAKSDTTSSPWVDYESNTAFVGADNGYVYQIAPAFYGTPALVGGSNWPVLISSNYELTPPVFDNSRGLLIIGSVNGNLYQVNTSEGLVTESLVVGLSGSTSPGIYATPIVDIANGFTFVVDADASAAGAEILQVDTATLVVHSTAHIGEGSSTGTVLHLRQPTFSNAYYTTPSDGIITLCGTGASDTTPYQYTFGFDTNGIMIETPLSAVQLSASDFDTCTGWDEFFNPYAGVADTVTATAISSDVLTVTASNSFTVGETVYIQGTDESFLNGQAVTVASLIGSGPSYTGFTANFTNPDYSNPADTGDVTVGTDFFFFGLTSDCTLLPGGTGVTTGCVVAMGNNAGTTTTTIAAVDGGPSGVIIDNYSTASEASSIYFTALSADTAFKFTQNGLQ
jgi:hypothetical protein